MSLGEFSLIKQYFSSLVDTNRDRHNQVLLGIGDDCAVTELLPLQQLAITTDTMVEGTHFLPDIAPEDLAHKAVTSNLSDLAAMGAKPAWISLALTLPDNNAEWLQRFSASLESILQRYQVSLIGGDTTKGQRAVTITAQGFLLHSLHSLHCHANSQNTQISTTLSKNGLYRHQAQVGDLIYVSGTLGDSAAGLHLLLTSQTNSETQEKRAVNSSEEYLLARHLRPTPRVELGLALNGIAHAAIDISDGLIADLSHILERSHCAAEIELSTLPISPELAQITHCQQAEQWALTGGEDYELCFTVPPQHQAQIERISAELNLPCTCIGRIIPPFNEQATESLPIYFLRHGNAEQFDLQSGYDHFKED